MSGARLPGKVVPWTCQAEWEYVMSLLYSSEDESVLLGYNFVRMWSHRGRIPTAVEATGNLCMLKVELHKNRLIYDDVLNDDEVNAGHEDHILQLSLTMALVRFVNEMVDPCQRGTYAQPITKLAEQIGLPRNLVDLRHSGTHDELPSLGLLVLALDQSLDWLKQTYWETTRNWKSALKSKFEDVFKRIDKDLADFGAKIVTENTSPEDQVRQRQLKLVSKALNRIEHLEVSTLVQEEFSECLCQNYFGPEIELIIECMNNWKVDNFNSILQKVAVANSSTSILESLSSRYGVEVFESKEKENVNTEDILDETEAILLKLAEKKRLKSVANDEWHLVTDWVPCDLGAPINFLDFV